MLIESIPQFYQIKNTPVRLWQVTQKIDTDMCEMHIHSNCEINYITSGHVTFTVKDTVYELKSGDIVFVNGNIPHSSVAYKGTQKIIFQFPAKPSSKSLKPLFNHIQNMGMDTFIFKPGIDGYTQIKVCLTDMINENQEEKFAFEEFIMADTYKIIAILYRYGILKNPNQFFSNQNYDRLSPVFEYIHAHYKENITLEQMSNLINVDKAYFCRLFKKTMNTTLIDYINLVRISYAEKFLTSSDLSITEISDEVGFGSNAYFTKIFKNQNNCTPLQYRKYKSAHNNDFIL